MKNLRPLSPHLGIYKPEITSSLSIFHRVTGVLLALIIFLTIISIKAITLNYTFYPVYIVTHYIIKIPANLHNLSYVIFILLLGFFYHLLNGIRHLLWDTGVGLNLTKVKVSGILVLITSWLLTALTYFLLFLN